MRNIIQKILKFLPATCRRSKRAPLALVGVLVGGRFLKCAPIGQTAAGPHQHWSLDSTHHGTQTKYCNHLGFLVGQTHSLCRPLLIIHCLGLLHQIYIGFVWVKCWSRWGTTKNVFICQIKFTVRFNQAYTCLSKNIALYKFWMAPYWG